MHYLTSVAFLGQVEVSRRKPEIPLIRGVRVMDIGTLVSWLQFVWWIVVGIGYLIKLSKREATMPSWLSSNKVWGAAVVIGLVVSSLSLYLNYRKGGIENFQPMATLAASDLVQIKNKHFLNESVDVDGKNFENCTFDNAKLIYHGEKGFTMDHIHFNGTIVVTADKDAISGFGELLANFGMISGPGVSFGEDEHYNFWVRRVFPLTPQPSQPPAQ
jgi:hypothetical protein